MINTTSLQLNQIQEDKMGLIDEYVKTGDPALLKEIERLNESEKLIITRQIIE